MANKVVKTKKENNKKHYVNPTDTWWGKALVWALFVGMVGFVVIGLIVAIVNSNA
ncbi:MAG: hypothetical protein RBT45_01495 [Acholeplasmataceae bacterium]|jgi:hypothetical protein|nr:hypothetical protein [Acholeplasmataceae bacterium]